MPFEELDRCPGSRRGHDKSFANCHNIKFNDRKSPSFWERMAEAKLPLLAHTGGEHTLPVLRPGNMPTEDSGAAARMPASM